MQADMKTDLLAAIASACTNVIDEPFWSDEIANLTKEASQSLLGEVIDCWKEVFPSPRDKAWRFPQHCKARTIATLLMRHGANPLEDSCHAFSLALCQDYPMIAASLIDAMGRLETREGISIRASDDGNALHHVLAYRPNWLGDMLAASVDNTNDRSARFTGTNIPLTASLPDIWLSQVNNSGETPLHVWWRSVRGEGEDVYSDAGTLSLFSLWDVSTYLLRAGAPLDAMDVEGCTPARLMVEAVDEKGVKDLSGEWMPRVRAIAQSAALDRSTHPSIVARHKARL